MTNGAGPSLSGYAKRVAVVAYDVGMAAVAYLGAYLLRYNLDIDPASIGPMWRTLPIVLALQAFSFTLFGLYRGVWRFASTSDLMAIIKAVTFGTTLAALGVFFYNRLHGVPRSAFVIDWFVLIVLLGSGRFAYRAWKDGIWAARKGLPTIVAGARVASTQVLREIESNPVLRTRVVGLVDDGGFERGSTIMGYPILGRIDDIRELSADHGVKQVIVAIPGIRGRDMRRIVDQCGAAIQVKTIPGISEIMDGRVRIQELRPVKPEDLLGREPTTLNRESIAALVAKRRVLVTGAGGSIGSELCRQIAGFGPSELIALDQSEYTLYQIDHELRDRYPDLVLSSIIADVCDQTRVRRVLAEHQPDMVLHAAAYKHVPLMEHNVAEAVRNNAGGTQAVARAALEAGVAKFVLISTDKAVNPTNVMGATKRIAEMLCQSLQGNGATQYTVVRFGNVLGSAGSVIELFLSQIAAGGPVTVTHPEITRYFMSIPEAALLVLQAATLGKGGELYLLDMGEPVKILDVARQMITLSGKVPGEDVEIKITGLRPGEKLFEELLVTEENSLPTSHPKIFVAAARTVDGEIEKRVEALVGRCREADEATLRAALRDLVPEYTPATNGLEPAPAAAAPEGESAGRARA